MVLYTGSEIGGWGWMSTFLKQNLQFTPAKSSIAVGLFWGGMTVGRIICGRLSLRYPAKNIILVLAFLSAGITVYSGFIINETTVLIVITLMGLVYSSLWPLIAGYGGNYRPENSGTVYALLIGCGTIGGALIPLLMGVIAQNINIRVAMISPAILFLLVAIIFINLKSMPKKA